MDVKQFTTPSQVNAGQYRELIERYRVTNPRKYAAKKEAFAKKLAQLEGSVWPPVAEPVVETIEVDIKPKKAKKVVDNDQE